MTVRRALFDKLIALRPVAALNTSSALLGVDAVQLTLPESSYLFRKGGGETVALRVDETILPHVLRHKSWQDEEADFLCSHAGRGPAILVDVGANMGLLSRQVLHRAPSIQGAVCFEPHPANFRLLCRNLAHLPQCYLVQAALSPEAGELCFYEDKRNAGNYSLNADAMRGMEHSVTNVRCLASSEATILAPLPQNLHTLPVIWKSDTQGSDEAIATSLPDSFWSRVRVGVMEIWRIKRTPFDQDRFVSILRSFDVLAWGDRDRPVSVEEVVEFSRGTDYGFRDLHFHRT